MVAPFKRDGCCEGGHLSKSGVQPYIVLLSFKEGVDCHLLQMKIMIISLLQPKVVAHAQHLFRTANGCGTLSPLKISNIQDLILFVSLHEAESHLGIPKWCYVGSAGSIRRVGIVLVSGVGAVEYKKNQDCFPQCNALFEQVRKKLLKVIKNPDHGVCSHVYKLYPFDNILIIIIKLMNFNFYSLNKTSSNDACYYS